VILIIATASGSVLFPILCVLCLRNMLTIPLTVYFRWPSRVQAVRGTAMSGLAIGAQLCSIISLPVDVSLVLQVYIMLRRNSREY